MRKNVFSTYSPLELNQHWMLLSSDSDTNALWGIGPLFVALFNNLKTMQHLKVLFLELSI